MFRASSAHLQEDIVVYKQQSDGTNAAGIQLCPEDEHLMLETCRGE